MRQKRKPTSAANAPTDINRKMKKNLLSIILCLAVYNLSAQTEVEPFVPGSTLEGVCYYLPRTAFRVTVIAEKTTTRPGDFYK